MSGGTFPRRALWQWVTYRRFSFVDLAMIVLLVQLLRGLWGLL